MTGESTNSDVTIVGMESLTPEQMREVEDMYHGDRSCRLRNMNVSCFGSERCNHSRPQTDTGVDAMHLLRKISCAGVRESKVVAFMSVFRAADCHFLDCSPPTTGSLISNLCVHEGHRNCGLCALLLRHAAQTFAHPLYVSIRLPDSKAPVETRAVMEARGASLKRLYETFDFERVHRGHTLDLYRYKAHPNARLRGAH